MEDEYRERLLELSDALTRAEESHRLVIKTGEHLLAAKERLTSKYLGKMPRAFDYYIREGAGEGSEGFAFDTDFALKKTENGLTNPSESYSLGQRELYALVTRFALIDALYDKALPFVILDDPFCHLDDNKMKKAMALVDNLAKTRQIIYLTCSEGRSLVSDL